MSLRTVSLTPLFPYNICFILKFIVTPEFFKWLFKEGIIYLYLSVCPSIYHLSIDYFKKELSTYISLSAHLPIYQLSIYLLTDVDIKMYWSSHCGLVVMNPTSIHKDVGPIPGLPQWVNDTELPWAVL